MRLRHRHHKLRDGKLLMRKLSALALILFLLFAVQTPASAQIVQFSGAPASGGGGGSFTPAWQSVKVCCGGLLNSIQVSQSDGTMLSAMNTYGVYLYKTTGTCAGADNGGWGTDYSAPCWEQLITATSVQNPTLTMVNALNVGVLEAVSCNSNTNDAYLWFNGTLLVTTNLKASAASRVWATTTLTTSINANQGIGTGTGRAIACDPNNPNIVYVGTPTALKKSTNGLSGASASFSTVSGVGTTGAIPSLITYDPNTTTSAGVSQHFWVFTDGTGFYETYNGGTSFTLTSGGPTTATTPGGTIFGAHAVSDQFSQLEFVNGSTTFYLYTPNGTAGGGTWTTTSVGGNGVYNIAVDPTSSAKATNRIFVSYIDGSIQISNNNGTSFTTWSSGNLTVSAPAGQPPWMSVAYQAGFLDVQDMVVDNSGNLFVAAGIGVWEATPTITNNPVNYVANSVGIEQLVTNRVLSAPGIGPVIAFWDRAFFGELNPDVFPSNFWTGANAFGNGVQAGWALDYASSQPTFLTGYVGNSGNYAASSSNGGGAWTLWPSEPSPNNIGGAIAASTPSLWILSPGEPSSIYYTANAGTTWNSLTVTGSGNWFNADGFRLPFAADRVAANTFCIVDVNRNFFVSTTSTPSFSLAAATAADGNAYNDQLKSVPGQSGHFFYGSGNAGGGVTTSHLWKSTSTCATWTDVFSGLTNVYSYGFGAPKPGGSGYPAIYAYGSISGVQGLYENDDGATTTTWTLITSPSTTWPNNGVDFVKDVSGDMNVYGRVYIGDTGSGSIYLDTASACPWVNFSNTLPNAALTGTVTLQAQSSGKPVATITAVNFYVDGTLIGTQTSGSTSGTPPVTTYSQSWVTGGVATGAHTLKVEATGNGCTTSSGGNFFSIPITTSWLDLPARPEMPVANDNSPMRLNLAA